MFSHSKMNRFSVLMQSEDDEARQEPVVMKKKLQFKPKNSITWAEFFDMYEPKVNIIRKLGLRERARLNREKIMHPKLSGKAIMVPSRKKLVPKFEYNLSDFPILKPVFRLKKDSTEWTSGDLKAVIRTEEWQNIPDPMRILEEQILAEREAERERRLIAQLTSKMTNATISDKEYTYMLNVTDSWHNEFQPILDAISGEAEKATREMMKDTNQTKDFDWNALEEESDEESFSDHQPEPEPEYREVNQWDCFEDDWN